MKAKEALPSSFRDPSGFLFSDSGIIYRQVNKYYQENYELLIGSGLYKRLVESNLLISHQEIDSDFAQTGDAYKILQPEQVPFISYPYEWCFSQLRKAALTTLQIQQIALQFDMSLKDASAYNIQFVNGKPILIDTLSFEKYRQGEPWIAYKQFCQHFLAPLALMSYTNVRLSQLMRVYIDGIPLDLASMLLPKRTRLKFSLLTHIHLHAKSQKHYAESSTRNSKRRMSVRSLQGLIDNLKSAISKLKWQLSKTEWGDYYDKTNYSTDGFEHKKELIGQFLDRIKPGTVWDIGGNTGLFSRIASDRGIATISFDIDPAAVEINYLECQHKNESNILPLLLDLTNPSPAIGWANQERMSLSGRGPADTVMALALVHHLAISNNLPLTMIASWFAEHCNNLVIEFIPKSDSQVERLLRTREDIFPNYTQEGFETAFQHYFSIEDQVDVRETKRVMYLMRKKPDSK